MEIHENPHGLYLRNRNKVLSLYSHEGIYSRNINRTIFKRIDNQMFDLQVETNT